MDLHLIYINPSNIIPVLMQWKYVCFELNVTLMQQQESHISYTVNY